MASTADVTTLTWKKSLPHSRMVRPTEILNFLKYAFWRFYTPFHPYFRDILLKFRIISHVGRQDFLIGRLAPNVSVQSLAAFLVKHGYGNHFIAWVDEGEVLGLRRVENFTHQYHIRIFKDGEIRAHYEYTPECYPIWHMRSVGMEDRRHIFWELLADKIVKY